MEGSLQESLLEGGACDEPVKAGTSWQKIGLIIITNFLGAGVLSLPYAASNLGYGLFLGLLVLVGLAAVLSGRAFNVAYLAVPEARVMSDVARAALGRRAESVVRCVQYGYMCGVLVIFHLTAAIALGRAVGGGCAVLLSACVAAAALSAMQARDMSIIGTLSMVGTTCIFIYIGLILVLLPLRGRVEGAEESVAPPADGLGLEKSLVSKGVSAISASIALTPLDSSAYTCASATFMK